MIVDYNLYAFNYLMRHASKQKDKVMNISERNKKIKLCGKKFDLSINESGQIGIRPLYCGIYYGENPCEHCRNYETHRRKTIVRDLVFSANELYKATIEEDDWATVSKQLRRRGADGIRVPQEDGTIIVFSTVDPYKKDSPFEQVDKLGAVEELGEEENLYSSGKNRSTFGEWALTSKKETSMNTIDIYILKPSFCNTDQMDGGITPKWLNELYSLHATTWTGGEVGLGNIQEYFNFVINKAIEVAIIKNAQWDIEGSKLVKWTISQEQIDNFSIGIVDEPNFRTQGDAHRRQQNKEYLLQINAIKPNDYVKMYLEYIGEKEAMDQLGEEDGLFNIFYGKNGAFLAKLDMYEKTNEETFLLHYTQEDLNQVIEYLKSQMVTERSECPF